MINYSAGCALFQLWLCDSFITTSAGWCHMFYSSDSQVFGKTKLPSICLFLILASISWVDPFKLSLQQCKFANRRICSCKHGNNCLILKLLSRSWGTFLIQFEACLKIIHMYTQEIELPGGHYSCSGTVYNLDCLCSLHRWSDATGWREEQPDSQDEGKPLYEWNRKDNSLTNLLHFW